MIKFLMKKELWIFIFILCSSILTDSAFSKEDESSEIIVTAQKQEQSISDVPISISVFNSYDLDDMKVESIKDIMVYTPNMSYFAAGGEGVGTPTIRGITASLRSFGTSTAMYVDGIPYTRGFGFDTILHDINQIEVLKGPQGTLYGKNAQAGVVNVTTKKPGDSLDGYVSGEIGIDEKKVFSCGVSGPLYNDKIFGSFSFKHHEKEGFMENEITGDSVNDQKYDFGRINLIFKPGDKLEISLLAQNISYDNGDLTINDINAPDPGKVTSDLNGYDRPSSFIGGLTAKYRFNDIELSSIFTYWDYEFDSLNDFDFTNSPLKQYHLRSKNRFEKISGEFRISSNKKRFKWLAGLYIDRDDDEIKNHITMMNNAYKMDITHDLGAETIGLFSHGEFDVTKDFSIIGGIRYDRDEKSFKEKKSSQDHEDSYNEISPKIALNYKLQKNSMIFATASKGYRAGGFNSFAPTYSQAQYLSYDKETVWNYEIGSKNSFFNKKVNLNLSIYYMDIKDMQVETAVDKIYTHVLNAAEATSKGFEIETDLKVNKEFTIFASFGYNDIKFDEFSDSKGDYKDNTNPFAPKYNMSLGGQYRSASGLFARVEINGYGKMYLDKANKHKRDGFALVNTKLGYEGESFDIYASCKNLFDEEYDNKGYYEGRYTIPSPPREISLLFSKRF